MERARTIILEIATVSQRVVSAATEYAKCRGFRNVQSCHFRLEKEMHRISVAAGSILGVLTKSLLPDGPPLDDRLQDWFSTDELSMCLDTLYEMEKMFRDDSTWMNTIFSFVNTLRSVPSEDKIDAAVKLFDSRRSCFHFLLTTDIWNCEDAQQRTQDGPAVPQVLEPNDDTIQIDWDNTSVRLSTATQVTMIEDNEKKQKEALRKLDDILEWLNGLSCAAKQEETLALRQPDTCTWLHSTPEYEAWRNSGGSSLWLQGKPGSGKTVLASFVIDSLQSTRRSGEALAFFYCDFRNDRSTSAAEVMRALLSQLLRCIRNENIDPGELLDDLTREKINKTTTLENVKRLATFVSRTAEQFGHQPFVVVDALDECEETKALLDGLLILTQGCMRLFVTSRPLQTIKFGLRGLPSLSMDKMTNAVSMDIALHVTRELDSSPRLRVLNVGFKTKIHSALCNRADGMFRWVQCQIDTLNRCATKGDVEKALKSLPAGLDETYHRILVAIDLRSSDGKLALRALKWLVGALRPLRSAEIFEGLTIDLGKRTMNPEIGAMHKDVLLCACGSLVSYNEKTDILTLSHFSVKEYLTGGHVLPRYHITPQHTHEHLARICICYIALYLRHVHTSHEDASQIQIMRTINGQSRNTNRDWFYFPESPPAVFCKAQELLGYVLTDGFNHLAYLGSASRPVLKDMVALQLDVERHPTTWELIHKKSQSYKPLVPWPASKHDFILYVLTAFASDSLLHAFLGPAGKKLQPRYQTNPLIYAAYFGKPRHAELFLSHGAKVNERGLVIGASRLALPLEIAVKRRRDAVVDLLVSAGSIVPKHLFTLSTYYYKYPIHIIRKLLETHEFVEWATEPGSRLPSPLKILELQPPLAYETDLIFIIQRLIQVGIDHTEQDSTGRTALHFAILGGYRAVVVYLTLMGTPLTYFDFTSIVSTPSKGLPLLRLVVEAGLNIHTPIGAEGDTILHLAIQSFQDECLEAVKFLIGAGCAPSAHNAAGKTPLHLALERGNCSVADYLMSLEGTPPSDILLAVAESRCPTTWRLATLCALVGGGMDKHGTRIDSTLLHVALRSFPDDDCLEAVKLFVGAGCKPFERDVTGKTPLRIALEKRNITVADYLLSQGTPPSDVLSAVAESNCPTTWKLTTLHALVNGGMCKRGALIDSTLLHVALRSFPDDDCLEAVKLFVDAGCEPFERDAKGTGKTPLRVALEKGNIAVADYLLSQGIPPSEPDIFSTVVENNCPATWRLEALRVLASRGADIRSIALYDCLLSRELMSLKKRHGLELAEEVHGAAPDPLGGSIRSFLGIPADSDSSIIADFLLPNGRSPPTDALFAVLDSDLSIAWKSVTICSLVGKGADVRGFLSDGYTLLHAAILSLDEDQGLDVAKILIGAGCDTFRCSEDCKTSLHIALDRNFPSIADYLLSIENPLPPDALFAVLRSTFSWRWKARTISSLALREFDLRDLVDEWGNNLLHAVLQIGEQPDVGIPRRFLRNPDSKSTLEDGQRNEGVLLDIIKLLVDSGCDPSQRDADNHPPVHLAIIAGYADIVNYLLPKTVPPPPQDAADAAPPHLQDKIRGILQRH